MTLSDFQSTHLLQAFSNVISCTAVQQLTRFLLTQCIACTLCDTRASCLHCVITASFGDRVEKLLRKISSYIHRVSKKSKLLYILL